MDFGKIHEKDLDTVSFHLPGDHALNAQVLKGSRAPSPAIYLGCAKWGRKEWLGKIYPPFIKENEYLDYYLRHYNSIELNATHYKIQETGVLDNWNRKAGSRHFLYCPKAHKGMSFLKHSPVRDSVTKEFIDTVRRLGKHLGPVFITHSEKIKIDEQSEKEFMEWLAALPKDISFFVEERWPLFFTNKKLMDRYYGRLQELGIGTVITDTAGRRDVLHMRLTTTKAFIRFVGNSLHPTDFPRIDDWANRLKQWLDSGLEEFYFFMHMHDEAKSPELTQYVVETFNRVCGLDLPAVKFV